MGWGLVRSASTIFFENFGCRVFLLFFVLHEVSFKDDGNPLCPMGGVNRRARFMHSERPAGR